MAIAVPGELKGYWEAHNKYGSLSWSELFEPAIALCRKGSRVNNYLAAYLLEKEPMIRNESTLAEILINPATNRTWTVSGSYSYFYDIILLRANFKLVFIWQKCYARRIMQ